MTSFEIKANDLDLGKPWQLVVRTHDLGGTDYRHICNLTDDDAKLLVGSGVSWLYGEPDWAAQRKKIEKLSIEREIEILKDQLLKLEEALGPDDAVG